MIGSKFNNILKSVVQINSSKVLSVKPIYNNGSIQFRFFSSSQQNKSSNQYNNKYMIASTKSLLNQYESLYNSINNKNNSRYFSSAPPKDPMEEKLKSMMSEQDKYEQYQKEKKARKEEIEKKRAEMEKEEGEQTKTIGQDGIHKPTTTSTTSTTKPSTKKEEAKEEKKIYDDEHEQSMFAIYSTFTVGFLALLATCVYNIASGFSENDNPFQLPYDKFLIIQEIYHNELLRIFAEGHPDFNQFAGASYSLSEQNMKHQEIGDTFIIVIPIVSKKNYLLGHLCIDIVQEGKVISVGNFFINGINGVIYQLRVPKTKYFTNDPKYSQIPMMPPQEQQDH
ncbi:hypothetical protein CYY_007006 [Polysphondylium violaceum]|uniref:Mitochondrial import inner membrane translocase subunit Tim21 n=1 Tax=Polysphondylium violaceum TaxID=133409 RepID=A0A8J4PPT1_9MYCE|nr:hypothetical protein CYY_007006 [Polysphondylium violaceum]